MFHTDAAAQDLLFFFGYFVVPTVIWGRTPGKWVSGIVVVDSDNCVQGLLHLHHLWRVEMI